MEYKGIIGSCPKEAKKKGQFKFEIRNAEKWKYPKNLHEEHESFASEPLKYAAVMETYSKNETYDGKIVEYLSGLINPFSIKKHLAEGNAIATSVNIGKAFKLFEKGDAYPSHLCGSKDVNHSIDVIGFS